MKSCRKKYKLHADTATPAGPAAYWPNVNNVNIEYLEENGHFRSNNHSSFAGIFIMR